MNDVLELREATLQDKATLANLLELYSYDFSEFLPADVDEQGRFGYRYLDAYWTDADRFPFLIRHGEHLAGFVLARRLPTRVMSIAEFFVLRRYRRGGVGRAAALAVIERFGGEWAIDVLDVNVDGHVFWRSVLAQFGPSLGRSVHDGLKWTTYRFSVDRGATV